MAAWDQLSEPWREAFAQAWESYQAGSAPVGAVLVGPDERIIAKGRSRRAESSAPPNQLAGSRLAHAEINALAQLGVDQPGPHTLYVTLEPCLLCWAAITIARVPRVSFAGGDPMWRFLGELPNSHAILSDRAFAAEGPMEGPLGTWAALLPLMERLWRDPTGARVDHFRRSAPALVQLAERMVRDGTARGMAELTLEAALASVWKDLEDLSVAP